MSKSYVTGRGNYNAICDICGFKYKASELRKRWDGQMCCPEDFELRHPSDFYRVKENVFSPPFVRSEADTTNDYNIFPTTYDPSGAQAALGTFSYGTKFQATSNGYFSSIKIYFPAGVQHKQMWLVLRNHTSGTNLWEKLLMELPSTEGWHSFPITPNVAAVATNEYIAFISTESPTYIGLYSPSPTIAANDHLTYQDSWYSSGAGYSPTNIPDSTSGGVLYLIDVSIRPT